MVISLPGTSSLWLRRLVNAWNFYNFTDGFVHGWMVHIWVDEWVVDGLNRVCGSI